MVTSVARPATTSHGVSELVRVWEPANHARAEVVLVHGLGEHSGRYERAGRLLADAGLRITSFDLVGFGASGGARGDIDSWTIYLDQVETHVRQCSSGLPVILMGHSMGGLIALEYALSARPSPDLLILSSPGLSGGKAWQRSIAGLAASLTPRVSVPNGLSGDQLSRDPAVGEAYFADPLVFTKSTTRLGAELFSAMDRVNANLGGLSVPTLVIHGGADTIVPASASAVLADLPTVKRRLYPKLRHEAMNEPEGPQVVADVLAWIDRNLTSEE
jgi:acylglycerol lipase